MLLRRTLRTFIGLDFDPAAKRELAALQRGLAARQGGHGLYWPTPPSFHLTLFFLGETPSALRVPIEAALEAVGRAQPPFPLTFGALDGFPSREQPRVLFLGVEDPTGLLGRLREALREGLARFDFPAAPAGFRPHVTLCKHRSRIRSGAPGLVELLATGLPAPPPSADRIEEMVFFESQLNGGGSTYAPLRRIPLSGR